MQIMVDGRQLETLVGTGVGTHSISYNTFKIFVISSLFC